MRQASQAVRDFQEQTFLRDLADSLTTQSDASPNTSLERVRSWWDRYRSSHAMSTLAHRRSVLGMFVATRRAMGPNATLLEPAVLERFLQVQSARGLSSSALLDYVTCLRDLHKGLGSPSPELDFAIRKATAGLRKLVSPHLTGMVPLGRDALERMTQHVDVDDASEVRDAALFALSYEAGVCPTELVAADATQETMPRGGVTLDDLVREDGQIRQVRIRRADRSVDVLDVGPLSSTWIDLWLRMSGRHEGPLFHMTSVGVEARRFLQPISRDYLRLRLKELASRAGFDSAYVGLRSIPLGLATDLLQQGRPLSDVARHGTLGSVLRRQVAGSSTRVGTRPPLRKPAPSIGLRVAQCAQFSLQSQAAFSFAA